MTVDGINLIAPSSRVSHLLTGAAIGTSESLAIGFSHSGLTLETAAVLAAANRAGATTAAVTNFPKSPVAAEADHVLTTSAVESRFRPGAMSSRIAQLAVVDFLFVRVTQHRYGSALPSLQLTYQAVQPRRYSSIEQVED